ncbi:MAG: glycosyltransferase family 9 protein [Chlamydiia bacterium]|nr:glycosyltransferase family 9 protein [Chlamydiia bacterium]
MIPDRPKFLIIKTSALGDIIQSFPVVTYLKRKFPRCLIDWVVEKKHRELVDAHPQIDDVIPFNRANISSYRLMIKKKFYEAAFDLQGNIKSGLLLSQARAKKKVGFGFKTVSEWPNSLFTNWRSNPPVGENIRSDYLHLVSTFLGDKNQRVEEVVQLKTIEAVDFLLPAGISKVVLVAPGARWKNKQLSLEMLIKFLKQVKGHFLVSSGSLEEKEIAKKIVMAFNERSTLLPPLSLPRLQNLMSKVSLVVAMDSLPLHLAGTTTTATISFFGPSNPQKFCPTGRQHTFFFGKCPFGITFEKRCPKLRTCSTGACMENMANQFEESTF